MRFNDHHDIHILTCTNSYLFQVFRHVSGTGWYQNFRIIGQTMYTVNKVGFQEIKVGYDLLYIIVLNTNALSFLNFQICVFRQNLIKNFKPKFQATITIFSFQLDPGYHLEKMMS